MLLFPVLIKEIVVGLHGPERPFDALIGAIGILLWVGGWLLASERKRAVREHLRVHELGVDEATLNENPRWVREQMEGHLSPAEWQGLLPLVERGWNGGFAWLTPELVREQMSRTLPTGSSTTRLDPVG